MWNSKSRYKSLKHCQVWKGENYVMEYARGGLELLMQMKVD